MLRLTVITLIALGAFQVANASSTCEPPPKPSKSGCRGPMGPIGRYYFEGGKCSLQYRCISTGNNGFSTLEECNGACVVGDMCKPAPEASGNCIGVVGPIGRWYFEGGKCSLHYRCVSTGNNGFSTQEQCNGACVPAEDNCNPAPEASGNCRGIMGPIGRWYFEGSKCNLHYRCVNYSTDGHASLEACNQACCAKFGGCGEME